MVESGVKLHKPNPTLDLWLLITPMVSSNSSRYCLGYYQSECTSNMLLEDVLFTVNEMRLTAQSYIIKYIKSVF